jgi:hypothetical protein
VVGSLSAGESGDIALEIRVHCGLFGGDASRRIVLKHRIKEGDSGRLKSGHE